MELFKASKQWAERPADERFWNLDEMRTQCEAYKRSACEATVKYEDLRVEAQDGEVLVAGKSEMRARLTHWAFGQMCNRAGAPASYLRDLPATLAAQNLNHGLSNLEAEDRGAARLLFHRNGSLVLRAATSDKYSRIWNADLVASLQRSMPKGWRVPPARPAGKAGERTRIATEADVLRGGAGGGMKVNVGDVIAPAGLYASDHDCFMFMVNEDAQVDDGSGHKLSRGFFAWNSEVGASSLGFMTFLHDGVCGNHIVWGAKGVQELRIRHIGNADSYAFGKLRIELMKYADSSASDLEARIRKARAFEFEGRTQEEIVNSVMAHVTKARIQVNRLQIEEAYDVADRVERYGAPSSAWALSNGLTELSQKAEYAEDRVKMDRAAGKILEIAF